MRHHVPRKLKKKAKKKKAIHDGMVMAQTALLSASSMAQLTILSMRRYLYNEPVSVALKAVQAARIVADSAQGVAKCMSQIKPWYEHIPNYKPRV